MQTTAYQIVVIETGEIVYEFFAGRFANIWPLNIIADRLDAIEHYERWRKLRKKNNLRTEPVKFICDLTKLSRDEVTNRLFAWHMEIKNGKKVRVNDHFELIPAPPLKN